MVSSFAGAVCLAGTVDVGTHNFPHSRPGSASVERRNTSGSWPDRGGLFRYADLDTHTRADASLALGFGE